MRTQLRIDRTHRRTATAYEVARPAVIRRPTARSIAPASYRPPAVLPFPALPSVEPDPDPYVDYGRFFTAEGGILICYKDIDMQLRHTLWRIFAWTMTTGSEGWFLFHLSPVQTVAVNTVALIAMGLVNWLIVRKPVEIYRKVEIRPDCMILDAVDLFWARKMEGGWPRFQRDQEGNLVLAGIYGTRFVEYLTARRFDECDRSPEVFAAHLQDAMRQLWNAVRT